MTDKKMFMQWVEKEHAHIFNEAERGDVRFRMDIVFMYMAWQASAKREGFVLVPKEPSVELVNLGHQVFLGHFNEGGQSGGNSLYYAYKAMLSAVEEK